MNRPDRRTFRVANLVLDQLAALPAKDLVELEQQTSCVAHSAERLASLRRKLSMCRRRGFLGAARRLREEATHVLQALRHDVEALCRSRGPAPLPTPTFRILAADLEQLKDEFGPWAYHRDERALSVATDPIELEGVYLGPFEIKLFLGDLIEASRSAPYCVIALDPHPAATSEQVTHPHVSNDGLCAGDASAAITAALASGRLCEFFLLVRSVLNTYNPHSPFVSLSDWDGEPCTDCGRPMSDDDRYWCARCEQDFCDECTNCCGCCDQILCRSCLEECAACAGPVCAACVECCAECAEPRCNSCLSDSLCPSCKESKEEHNEQDKKEKANEQPPRLSPADSDTTQTIQTS
jgi:hypothetical protein